jgi:hypothetical protein
MGSNPTGGRASQLAAYFGIMFALALGIIGFSKPVFADEREILLRKSADFNTCKASSATISQALRATPEQISIVRDTGAEYRLLIAAQTGRLFIACNKVTDQMEIWRANPVKPGQDIETTTAGNSSQAG